MPRRNNQAKRFKMSDKEIKGAQGRLITKRELIEEFKTMVLSLHFLTCQQDTEPYNHMCIRCGCITMYGQQPSIMLPPQILCLQDGCVETMMGTSEEMQDVMKYLQ